MWILGFIAYMLVTAAVFGVETYATHHVEYSPFYHWDQYEPNPAGLVSILVAAAWPICAPFYFAAIIAGAVAKHAKEE